MIIFVDISLLVPAPAPSSQEIIDEHHISVDVRRKGWHTLLLSWGHSSVLHQEN